MGNRAVITTPERRVGLYLHWNGGRDSVEAFLRYCELQNFRPPSFDEYGWARLCQVIANYFGGTLSVGIDSYTDDNAANPGDNGIYVIDGWNIVDRVGLYDGFEEQYDYPLQEMLLAIDEAQPAHMQLGADFLNAEVINTSDLLVGDQVFIEGIGGGYELCRVSGFGDGRYCNGETEGVPIVERYCTADGYPGRDNPNNYLRAASYRAIRAYKKCPRCGTELFSDMETCYGCLYDFSRADKSEQAAKAEN